MGKWQLGDDAVILLYTRFFEFEAQRVIEFCAAFGLRYPPPACWSWGGLFGEEKISGPCGRRASVRVSRT